MIKKLLLTSLLTIPFFCNADINMTSAHFRSPNINLSGNVNLDGTKEFPSTVDGNLTINGSCITNHTNISGNLLIKQSSQEETNTHALTAHQTSITGNTDVLKKGLVVFDECSAKNISLVDECVIKDSQVDGTISTKAALTISQSSVEAITSSGNLITIDGKSIIEKDVVFSGEKGTVVISKKTKIANGVVNAKVVFNGKVLFDGKKDERSEKIEKGKIKKAKNPKK